MGKRRSAKTPPGMSTMVGLHLNLIYPLVICYVAIENDPVEIVDKIPLIAWWIFPVRYVSHYQRVFVPPQPLVYHCPKLVIPTGFTLGFSHRFHPWRHEVVSALCFCMDLRPVKRHPPLVMFFGYFSGHGLVTENGVYPQ